MEKLNTVREITPATIEEIILRAVVASRRLSQCNCDFSAYPVVEKSNSILIKDNNKNANPRAAG
jgi:hypothetical protein